MRAVGVRPRVLHLNEGHSAFAVLERARERMEEDGQPFDVAFRDTAIETVFSTHTPVAAGHDRFSPQLVESQAGWLRSQLGLDHERFLALGRANRGDQSEAFCMTVLALRGARHRNGVSSLHGHVSRQMWQGMFARPEEQVPIGHITNGVHVLSWLAPSMKRIYDRVLGLGWTERQWEPETWRGLTALDPAELWEAHSTLRLHLVDFVRRRSGGTVKIDPDALTIGFARRFATYKRATLLLSDPDWLERLCADANRPVQFIIAGLALQRGADGPRLCDTSVPPRRGRADGVLTRYVQREVLTEVGRRAAKARITYSQDAVSASGIRISHTSASLSSLASSTPPVCSTSKRTRGTAGVSLAANASRNTHAGT